ncbi:MAG: PE-PPE domain-containing protein [Dietzia sp.]|nr:PE-PPE domain-containing protein [Dietzia sp.]
MVLPIGGGAVPVTSAAAFDYFHPGPARVLTLSLIPGGNDDDLQGAVCASPRTCETVDYPYFFRSAAVANLDEALRDGTTGQQYVFAYSQGARVVSLWLKERSEEEGAPTPDVLSFVLMGNPGRKHGGADNDWDNVVPDSGYKVIDVSRQYDPASDYPDNPFNLLALLNAHAGLLFVHQDYEEVDIYDPANYVWTEGNTTYVYVPTKNIPLLQPLRWLGLSGLADSLNGPLKEIIERAYDRSYLPAAPGLPPGEPDPEPEEPRVDPEEPPADLEDPPTDPEDPAEPPTAIAPEDGARMASGTPPAAVPEVTIEPVDTAEQPESVDSDADPDAPDSADEGGDDDAADDTADGAEGDQSGADDEAGSGDDDNTSTVTTRTTSKKREAGAQSSRQADSSQDGADSPSGDE